MLGEKEKKRSNDEILCLHLFQVGKKPNLRRFFKPGMFRKIDIKKTL